MRPSDGRGLDGSAGLAVSFEPVFDADYTLRCITELLTEIRDHPRRDLFIPHGFEVERVTAEDVPETFTGEMCTGLRITIDMRVPTIYSAKRGPHGLRACLPADRENLDALRAAIVFGVRAYVLRARLREWNVAPDEAPSPYLPNGTPSSPPANWSVTAVLAL